MHELSLFTFEDSACYKNNLFFSPILQHVAVAGDVLKYQGHCGLSLAAVLLYEPLTNLTAGASDCD